MYRQSISLLIHFLITQFTNGLYNAALYKPAVQSTTYYALDTGVLSAYLAVDGNKNTDVHNGHCQHTQDELIPWWMVDLRGQFVVDAIRITNRGDSFTSYRLRNFAIDIFEQDPRPLRNFPDITGTVLYKQQDSLNEIDLIVTLSTPVTGRFVRLYLNGSSNIEVLHICEMEIYVSDIRSGENLFNVRVDTRLSGLILDTVTVSDPYRCVQECLVRRSSTCTAFNWDTTSNTCQLFSVNPDCDLTSYLTSAPGTHFYIQDNSIQPFY